MARRHPDISAPPGDFKLTTTAQSKTYAVETITPIFGGGVEAGVPDTEMPIRASAIRGQLRFWWRFLASHRPDNPIKDPKALFEAEREIWGGMGEKGEDYASKIFIRIHDVKNIISQAYDDKQVEYALFPAKSEKRKKNSAKDLIKPGVTFTLSITAPTDELEHIEYVIRWWMSFGGIGARTRRGLGSINIQQLLPIDKEEVEVHKGCQLAIRTIKSGSALSAWEKAIEYLANFRQKPVIGRNPGTGNTPGRSHWPEPDSIRLILNTHSTKKTIQKYNHKKQENEEYACHDHSPNHDAMISFPRAFFGLPINFKFKDEDCGEPKESQLIPSHSERLASPLILKPYRISEGKYACAALLLPFNEIDKTQLQLKVGSRVSSVVPANLTDEKTKQWNENNWQYWNDNWWNSAKAKHVKPIHEYSKKGEFTNPLTAFMHYFGGKQ